ncbi:MAG: aspartate aminotransferase family protein [Desulfobacteraceae bacterium]|nr:MAG: aspartate aminotransferase family protein [Desulfobacteraceae bacterium]
MKHILWSIGHELKLDRIEKASGCYVYDSSGQAFLDLESGVWCTPLGHCHPEVVQAMETQARTICHTGYCYAHPVIEQASEQILDIAGFENGKSVFLCSGSEAVEFGVKALKSLSDKPMLLTLHDSFLGSYGSSGTKPETEWTLLNWEPCQNCDHTDACHPACPVFDAVDFDRISGFVFEPGSASGLVRFPPNGLIRTIAQQVKERDGHVQVNEITTGMGRSGKWFGFQHYDIQPDIVSMGKGLGNGYPVSAIAMTKEAAGRLEANRFYYSQSHQNDPLGAAVAAEVIRVMKRVTLPEQARSMGQYLKTRLEDLGEKFPVIRDIRGKGLILSISFDSRTPDDWVVRLAERLLNTHRIITAKRPGHPVIRIDPPLVITRDQIDHFLEALDQCLAEMAS